MLTVLEPTEKRVRSAVVWRCKCDCGAEVMVESRRLKPGLVYSCGCMDNPDDLSGKKDLTGLQFGKLTVIEKSANRAKDRNPLWICQCEYGNQIETTKRRLIQGNIQSCGCGKKPPLKAWTGKRFGKLTVESYAGKEKGFHLWHCKCDCGKEVNVRQSHLQSGWTTSCGCLRSPSENLHYLDGTCVELLNSHTMYKSNTSGVRGVYYNKRRKKWVAQIMFRQKCYHLGGYEKLEDAAKVRALAEEKLFGDFLEWYETEGKSQ